MQLSISLLIALGAGCATAQQYAGDVISAYLPTIDRAEVAFFKIPDPSDVNNNLTLINYYGHGSNGGRIVESKIERAVIVLHGLLRDPWNYQNDLMNALDTVTDPNINHDTVATMAPYFANGDDKGYGYPWTDGLKAGQGSTSNALVWPGSSWSAGADNRYPHNSRNTSSFFVLDTLVKYFDDTSLFPNMKQIVLVGHSMGGQMVQRYAAVGDQLNTNSPVTYWVGNPNSLSWLSEDRPLSHANCPDYDDYREGYTNYTEYGMTYGTPLVNQGREAILANFNTKQVAWARGLLDHGDHSEDCAPYSTGEDRNERFFYFIKQFQPSCANPSGKNCDTVDLINVSHDNGQMFKSSAGIARLFTDNFYGDGKRSYDQGYPRLQNGDDPYPDPSHAGENGVTNYNTYAGGMTYQGCWTNQVPVTAAALPTLLYDNSGNSIEGCASGCAGAGFTIAGVQNATQCYCGNTLNSQSAVLTVDNACRLACAGSTGEICGGPNRLSLFSNGYPKFT
ncbi:hypothetical protein AAFC00_006495 [Neodothiora populina]|uniref:WSC domain-containing protein n=1 Tax=Neodothiora populina TaxID=2781224 RepID=A0ABR3P5E7_9PEZI